MQGKGKQLIAVPQIEVATYGSQGIKKKSIVPSKSITLHYFDSKAILSLEIGDQKLTRVIVDFFRKADTELQQFSILNHLRLGKRKLEQKIYYHKVDTKEALSLIFYLQQVREGRIIKTDQQLQELVTILNDFQINQNEIDRQFVSQFDQQRRGFNNEVYHCRKAIKTIIQERILQIKDGFTNNPDYIKLLILQTKLKQLGLELFESIVVGLRQVSHEEVEIIYQQCYASRRCSIMYLKEKIGQEMYLRKKMDFVRMFSISQREGLNNTNLIVCHMCKNLLKQEYIRCSQLDMPIINITYKNSPTIYYKRLIAFDYCYDSYDPPSLENELDYFKYTQYPLQRRHCSRLYCRQCLTYISPREGLQDILKHKCEVCRFVCACHSCRIANQIVVELAIIRDLLTRNYQSAQKYREIIDYINFNDCKDQSMRVQPYLRVGFRSTGKQEYLHSYNLCMDRFQMIYQAIDKYRDLANAFPQELQAPSIIFTPQMKLICHFLDDIRHQNQGSYRTFTQRMNQHFQNKPAYKPGDHYSKQKKSSHSAKKKYEINPDLHNTLRKFCIGKDEPIQIAEEWMLEEERNEIENQLLEQLEPASESIVGKIGMIKNEVPFEEEDYERMHVAEQYKLMTERQIQFQRLVEAGIFHQVADPQFSALKFTVLTFFQDVNDYFRTDQSVQAQGNDQSFQYQPEQSNERVAERYQQAHGREIQGEVRTQLQAVQGVLNRQREGQECQSKGALVLQSISCQSLRSQCKIEQELKGEVVVVDSSEKVEVVEDSDQIEQIGWQEFMSFTPRRL